MTQPYKGRGGKREGAYKPYKEKTKVVRVPANIPDEKYKRLGELLELINMYEDDAIVNTSPRKEVLLKMIEEIRLLGF